MFSSLRVVTPALLCVLLYTTSLVDAHSWVACTDYRGDRATYNPAYCFGFPRNWQNSGGVAFGVDTGFNYQAPQSGSRPCRDPLSGNHASGYSSSFPMAKYKAGSTVCLAWPSKNHVAATCTNQYIPDTSLKLFAAPTGDRDPRQSTFSQTLIRDWTEHQNGVIDFKGFQNCPRFCDNMDKSLCSQCFTVPSTLQVGKVYTFQWYWVFNQGTDPYTTCWEAMIVAGDGSSGGDSGSTTGSSSGTPSTTGAVVIPPPICNGNGGSGNGGNVPSIGDNVVISKAPFSIPSAGTFDVVVAYSASGSRQITVDVLDTKTSPTWYGKGTVTVQAGKGTTSVRVTSQGNPPSGPNYVLRAWMIDTQYASRADPWTFELSRNDFKVSVGSTAAVYSAAAADCADTSKCDELCGGATNVSTCECDVDGNVNVICSNTPEPQAVSRSSSLYVSLSALAAAVVAAIVA